MRIVHFGKFYPPEWGGIENVTEALAEEHCAMGHEVTVVCFTHEKHHNKEGNPRVIRTKAFTTISSQPLSLRYLFVAIRFGRRADVVHLHAPNLLASFASLFLSRRTKLLVQWHADIGGKGLLGKIFSPLQCLMLKRAAIIACTSPVYADSSQALEKFSDKIQIIPLGIPQKEIVRSENKYGEYILSVGRLVPYKGFDVLLKAISLAKKIPKTIIVGTGPLEGKLREQARELGVCSKVLFIGQVDEQELMSLYDNALFFCLPSINKSEAFGVVLLEAMRAGRALLTTDIPGSGVSWVNQDRITGRVAAISDPNDLASCIVDLLDDRNALDAYADASHERFLEHFTQKRMAERMLDAYCLD